MFSTIQHDQEKVHNLTLLPQEGRREYSVQGSGFSVGWLGDWYLTQVLTGSWYTLDA